LVALFHEFWDINFAGVRGGYVTLRGQAEWTPRGIHFLRVYAYFHFFAQRQSFRGLGVFFAKNSQKVAKMAKKDRKGLTPRSKPLNLWG